MVVALGAQVAVGVDHQRQLGERTGRGAEHRPRPVEDLEGRLVTRTEQALNLVLVQADRAPGVRADLRVRDVALGRPVLPAAAGRDRVARGADEQGLRVGRVEVPFGEHSDDTADLEIGGVHQLPLLVHQARALAPFGDEERVAGSWPERSDREQRGQAERTGRGSEHAQQEAPTGHGSGAFVETVEVARKTLDVSTARLERLALLGEGTLGEQVARRHDEREPSPLSASASNTPSSCD